MRIAIVICHPSLYSFQQANALAKYGHKVLLLIKYNKVTSNLKNICDIIHPGVDVYIYAKHNNLSRMTIGYYYDIIKKLNSMSPDVIHIHETSAPEAHIISMYFHNIPIVVTVHDVVTHLGKDSDIGIRKIYTIKSIRNRADIIHVHSNKLKEYYVKLNNVDINTVICIPHGTYTLYKHWDINDVSRDRRTCLFFGRMEKYRGLDNLIQIAEIVKQHIKDIKIIVAGTGTDLKYYKDKMLNSAVFDVYDDFIPDEKVYQYFKKASILLLPYHEGSQSGVIHIALAFGMPTVAMDVGAIREAISDGIHGYIVKQQDLEGFSNAIISIIKDDELYKNMMMSCNERGNELEFENLITKYEGMYEKAISIKKNKGNRKYG